MALVLGLIVLAGLALRLHRLGADPPLALSPSNAEVMDGPWYLAEAADRTRGLDTDVPPQYCKRLFTALMRIGFLGGVSLERAHATQAFVGSALVLLAAGAARRAFGTPAALLTAFLLATGFLPVGYSRTTVVYGPLATGLAGVFWLLAFGRPGATVLAWLLLGALALWLQPVAIVMAPALAVGSLVRSRRRLRTLGAVLALAGVGGVVIASLEPDLLGLTSAKAVGYFGSSGPLDTAKRWLAAPFASGLWPGAPLVCLLAWGGVLTALGSGRHPDAADARAMEASLAAGFVVWSAVFGLFEYTEGGPPPLRYFIPALVPAALLAGRLLARLAAAPGVILHAPRPLLFVWAMLGTYWALGTCWTGLWKVLVPPGAVAPRWLASLVSFPGLLACALVGAGVATALPGPRFRAHPIRLGGGVVVLVAAGLVADAARLYPMLARPTYSLRDANAVAARLLAPNAHAYGPWAHALTYDAPYVRRHHPGPTRLAELVSASRWMTHLLFDRGWMHEIERGYARLGIRPVLLARLDVRGHAIMVFRLPWAEELGYRLSALERELHAEGSK